MECLESLIISFAESIVPTYSTQEDVYAFIVPGRARAALKSVNTLVTSFLTTRIPNTVSLQSVVIKINQSIFILESMELVLFELSTFLVLQSN